MNDWRTHLLFESVEMYWKYHDAISDEQRDIAEQTVALLTRLGHLEELKDKSNLSLNRETTEKDEIYRERKARLRAEILHYKS